MNVRNISILWDIDGTLLSTGGAGVPAFAKALNEHIKKPVSELDRHEFLGLTDFQIAELLLTRYTPLNVSSDNIDKIVQKYSEYLVDYITSENTKQIDNVGAKIEYLKKYFPHLNHHIATGNIISGAIVKLKASDLYNLFVNSKIFSALSIGPRSQIIKRAKDELHIGSKDVVVIGDTLNDLKAANEARIPSIILTSTEFEKTIRGNRINTININWSIDELVNGIYNAVK